MRGNINTIDVKMRIREIAEERTADALSRKLIKCICQLPNLIKPEICDHYEKCPARTFYRAEVIYLEDEYPVMDE